MIEEAYVSYEVAKLLKEKSFDSSILAKATVSKYATKSRNCYGYSMVRIDVGELLHPYYYESVCFDNETDILAPTQQMAMRWLREEKNIIITIQVRYPNNPEITTHPYSFMVEDFSENRDKNRGGKYMTGYTSRAGMDEFLIENDYIKEGLDFGEFLNYEEAVEAALKYTLENLI